MTKKKDKRQEQLEILDKMGNDARKAIVAYNKFARKNKLPTRLGIINSGIDDDEVADYYEVQFCEEIEDKGKVKELIQKYLETYDPEEFVKEQEHLPYPLIDRCDAEYWFPSAICPWY